MVNFRFFPKLVGFFKENIKKPFFQASAIKKTDKIEHGEKVLAPKHPTDEKAFQETLKDTKIKEVKIFWGYWF